MTACTDDERRRVAERLRCAAEQRQPYTQPTLACFIGADCVDIWTRLAELIEPSDTSHGRRDTVACDPTGRGIDSIYEWCRGRLEGADGAEDYLYCTIMRAIEDYRHPERATAHTVRAVDRDALLALADEMEEDACWEVQSPGVDNRAWMLKDVCDRIREALGVVA